MKEWFRSRHIRQEQIAERLGISVATVSRILNGKTVLRMEDASKLHAWYGIPFDVMSAEHSEQREGQAVVSQ